MPRSKVTVEVLRTTTTKDRYGNETTSDEPVPHDLEGCSLQPLIGSEDHDLRAVVTRWQLFGPQDGDLRSDDQVRYAGQVYAVEGDVQRWEGRRGYMTAILQRVGPAAPEPEEA